MNLTIRQVRRLQRRYEEVGSAGLVSKRRGKPSNRRLPDEVKDAVLARLHECYADFGPTLAAEYLRDEGLLVSKETLHGWMIDAGLWQAVQGHRVCLHPPRPRRPRCGELVQIDGSPHDWFEGRGPRYALRGESVTVVVYPDQRIELLHGEEILSFKVFDPAQTPTQPVDDKTLNTCVDDVLKARRCSEKYRLAPNGTYLSFFGCPWRRTSSRAKGRGFINKG